ncbi:hypothetical protein FJTKL_05602 [Diaporthe vaccinii]|uniref:Glucose receptor Git3-like N-terminal domain-containing protein n=1 Tax=Diaporthe vaccinii TaxID=105482 RepID=A0ABR4DRS7_9PEZI
MAYDDVVANFTLAGSLISCIATCCVLVSYMVYRDELRSFRQALVFNLALAEFLNTLNNSISGSIYVRSKTLNSGPACIANGFINQLTVQAVDFTIMAIVIVTLLTITQKTYLPSVSFAAKAMICLSTWAVPIITSTTAVAMRSMSPVSGNWCWITAKRTDLRYALTHGWRIAIIFLTVVMYAYIWWYVHCHFKALFGSERGRSGSYNPFTGTIRSEKDKLKNRKTEHVALKARGQPLNIVVDSNDAPSGEPVWQKNALRRESSSFSTEASIKTTSPQSRAPCHGIDDAATPGWSPLQKPTQTRLAKQHVFYPAVPITTQERDCRSPDGIVRSFDIHVSFAKQHPHQRSPLVSEPGVSSPPRQHSVEAWPYSQMATVSCTASSSSSGTRPAFRNHAEGQSYFSHGSSPEPSLGHRGRGFEREIRRMLLLNAYPTLYVLLWIPGIVNRFMEATGTAPSNTRIVGALQSTSQFVGFANALTFGLSATMRRRIASAAPSNKWRGRPREV